MVQLDGIYQKTAQMIYKLKENKKGGALSFLHTFYNYCVLASIYIYLIILISGSFCPDRLGSPWIVLDRPGSSWIALPWIVLDRPGSPWIAPGSFPGSQYLVPSVFVDFSNICKYQPVHSNYKMYVKTIFLIICAVFWYIPSN